MTYQSQTGRAVLAAELTDFEKVLRRMPVDTAIQGLDLVETLTRKIIQNPSEEKFRRLRCANEKLQPIFGTAQGRAVMVEMGWEFDESSEFLVISQQQARKLDFPQHIAKILDAKSYFGKQIEKEKNAKRIAGADKKTQQLMQELENDRRERSAADKLRASNTHVSQPVASQQDIWSCGLCTYQNSESLPHCEMCGGEKPKAPPPRTHEPSLVKKTAVAEHAPPPQQRSAFDFQPRK
jgi:hypothetical protein